MLSFFIMSFSLSIFGSIEYEIWFSEKMSKFFFEWLPFLIFVEKNIGCGLA